MGFNRFRIFVLIRVIVLFITVATFVYLLFFDQKYVTTVVTGFLIIFEVFELFNYIESTNKKLARFFDAIKYNDFNMSFTHDNKLGKTFKALNLAFKDVIDAILEERKKSEQSFQQLRVVVENIGTGIIAINETGEVKLINRSALHLLQLESLRSLDDLRQKAPNFHFTIDHLNPSKRAAYKNEKGQELVILETMYKLGGELYRLIALQDIKAELQAKELEAWQNLTKVLRHEIMNSIAPISSLTSTLSEVLKEDVIKKNGLNTIEDESLEDLTEGLSTISSRSEGLINFVNAYRDYTNLPEPDKRPTDVKSLVQNTTALLKNDFLKANVVLEVIHAETPIQLNIDYQLIEQVLINILKNALEVVENKENAKVKLETHVHGELVTVSISDNGAGITPEATEKIFMPFFSTKNRGSGIGLSLSKQIMQLHGGDIQLETELGKGATFRMVFHSE
ncbi:sensor histidine kinase [Roseivirga seohaensis]|uniref:sensor histidine kinase n=1 Tax=Roseivirga seohaensis TaxID=1914963 RepID=UPI00069CD900|nr:ATP-binding protein [Roseivirga seohaensis]|tara:strand:- start:757 stop:2112 length:1356 start_codon:yes stop_codon:yes gene_type:complete